MPFTTPYVRSRYETRKAYEPRQYQEGGENISALMRQGGSVRADAERRKGDISARTLSDIGALTAQTIQSLGQIPEQRRRQQESELINEERRMILQDRREAQGARQQAGRDESTAKGIMGLSLVDGPNGVKTYDRDLIAREFQTAGIADRLPAVMAGLDEFEKSALEFKNAKQQFAQKAMQPRLALVAAMDFDPLTFQKVAEEFVGNGFMSADEVYPLVQKAKTPDAVKQIVMGLTGQTEKPTEGQVVAPGAAIVKGGQEVYRNPAREAAEPNPTEWSVLLRAAGGDPQKALKLKAQQDAAGRTPQSDAEPLMSVIDPATNQPVYRRRSAAEGMQPASSREQGRPVTSGDAGRVAELDTSLNDLATLAGTLGETSNATGTSAKVGAMLWKPITDLTGWGLDAKKRQGVIDRVKQVIGKALEGGVLRKEDEIKYEKILPTIGDPQELATSKLEGLRQALVMRRQSQLEALADAGYDTSRFEARTSGSQPSEKPAASPSNPLEYVAPNGTRLKFPTKAALDGFLKKNGLSR